MLHPSSIRPSWPSWLLTAVLFTGCMAPYAPAPTRTAASAQEKVRTSNRATADPGYDLLGLPYHRGLQSDRADLTPGQPVELVIDLFPTSTLFQPGHRLRVTITGADKANAHTPEQNPPPRLTIWREVVRGSYIELPVIPG